MTHLRPSLENRPLRIRGEDRKEGGSHWVILRGDSESELPGNSWTIWEGILISLEYTLRIWTSMEHS